MLFIIKTEKGYLTEFQYKQRTYNPTPKNALMLKKDQLPSYVSLLKETNNQVICIPVEEVQCKL